MQQSEVEKEDEEEEGPSSFGDMKVECCYKGIIVFSLNSWDQTGIVKSDVWGNDAIMQCYCIWWDINVIFARSILAGFLEDSNAEDQ